MLARTLTVQEDEGGFTLIELLVVIIIIGILAAIAIPTFLKQREKGWLAAIKSDIRNAATAEESYATDNNGSYVAVADAGTGVLASEGFNKTADVTIVATTPTTTSFVLCGSHSKLTGKYVHYTSATGQTTVDGTACS